MREETLCTGFSGLVGEEGFFLTVEITFSEEGDECSQENRDYRRLHAMNLGCKRIAVGREALSCAEAFKKA